MNNKFIADEVFEKIDYTANPLGLADYDACRFVQCNFTGTDLSRMNFSECEFDNCNLSNVKLSGTGIKEAKFKGCKLAGLHFEDCSDFLFAASFESCILNFSTFHLRKMKNTLFADCTMQEMEFSETELTGAVFKNCDLLRTLFIDCNLEKADLRTAYNYTIDPERNKLKKAKFSLQHIAGLLAKYEIEID